MPPTGETDERILAVYRETIDERYAYVSRSCYWDRTLAEVRLLEAFHFEDRRIAQTAEGCGARALPPSTVRFREADV
jgi:hypothetical protein